MITWIAKQSLAILIKCPQCQVPFLTSVSNRGRNDIRCPFGCRELHKKQQSNKRVNDYYQSKEGKKKKQQLNQNRKKGGPIQANAPPEKRDIIIYIRFIISCIWNYKIDWSKAVEYYHTVCKKMRQHPL